MRRVTEIDEEAIRLLGLQRSEQLMRIADYGRGSSLATRSDLFIDLSSELGFL
jgi:hypothetical protein